MSIFQIVMKKNKISNMKTIKVLAIIFTAISVLVIVPLLVYFMIKYTKLETPTHEYLIYGLFTLMVLNIAIGGLTIIRLRVNSKSWIWGILTFIFVSPIAGAFYLVWNPKKE